MKNKVFGIIYAVVLALLAVALIVFMIIHITKGLVGGNQKLILAGYGLMIVWAIMKLYNAIKNLRQ